MNKGRSYRSTAPAVLALLLASMTGATQLTAKSSDANIEKDFVSKVIKAASNTTSALESTDGSKSYRPRYDHGPAPPDYNRPIRQRLCDQVRDIGYADDDKRAYSNGGC